MLYCPQVSCLPYEKLFTREIQKWQMIEQLNQGHAGDIYRTPLLIRFVI